jgi:precorrin-2/cobalt-factor-2 C20-methyltransferase
MTDSAAPTTAAPTAPAPAAPGSLYGIGVGPGDPELMTLKAHRLLRSCPVVAHFAARGREGNARAVVAPHLLADQRELRLEYPVTTETLPEGVSYETLLVDFYDASAKRVAELLDDGIDVALVCEGDPFFYGSYMYMHNRLATEYRTEVVPAVPSITAGAAVLGTPLVCRDEVLCVLSGVLPEDELVTRLSTAGAAVVMKLGRNLGKVRAAVTRAGLLDHAHYVERATMATQRVLPLAEVDPATAPYFSMVVIPSRTAPGR